MPAPVGAVGLTTATVVEQSRGQIKAVSLNGIIPSAENVGRKTYTLTRDSFLSREAYPPNDRMNPPAVFSLAELQRRVAAGYAERSADIATEGRT